jgi:hypothetical protein
VAEVRRWAVSVWARCHPQHDLTAFAAGLQDDDPAVVATVLQHLARAEDPAWDAVLLHALDLVPAAARPAALRALGARARTLPRKATARRQAVVERVAASLSRPADAAALVAALDALEAADDPTGEPALARLHARLQARPGGPADDALTGRIVALRAQLGGRRVWPELLAAWREVGARGPVADGLGVGLGLPRTAGGLPDPAAAEDAVAAWEEAFDVALLDPDDLLRIEGAAHDARAGATALRATLTRHTLARRLDPSPWVHATLPSPARDVRALWVATDALLDAIARAPDDARAPEELGLALAAVLTTLSRLDELGALDPTTAARRLRATAQVPDAIATALQRQRGGLQALLGALQGKNEGTGPSAPAAASAATLLTPLAARRPTALRALVAALDDPRPHVARAALDALDTAGEAAAAALADRLERDLAPGRRQGSDAPHEPLPDALLAAAARRPTPRIRDALARHLREGPWLDVRVALALADLGEPSVAGVLAAAWRPGQPALAARLQRLAALHPDAPKESADAQAAWRADLAGRPP